MTLSLEDAESGAVVPFGPANRFAGRKPALVCFSHLRWNSVFQRPHHLISRMSSQFDVTFWEEPMLSADVCTPKLIEVQSARPGVTIATPHLPDTLPSEGHGRAVELLLSAWAERQSGALVRWYYTPMMLPFSRSLSAVCTVYDCMDELANFKFAPPELQDLERELLATADLVFTGGASLYESKRRQREDVHLFPSSVERAHFARARQEQVDVPADQGDLPSPRLGFYGVIDERLDLDLLQSVARARPDWTLVMIGPIAKIDPASLPHQPNIHYLGPKAYEDLPAYLAGWDVALMPFALNESTRFISPTKTPEYLAGGKPVVSTPISDVARQWGAMQGVAIAEGAEAFVAACERALRLDPAWREQADAALGDLSWDRTHAQMSRLVQGVIARRVNPAAPSRPVWQGRSKRPGYDILVVGAGFAGAVAAERLASQGNRVLVVDRRSHVGGNAFDRLDAAGVRIHEYGPHIFHTNSADIFAYLSRFTRWRPYEHRVLADTDGKLVPIPINRTTLNTVYDADLRGEDDAAAFLAKLAEPCERVRTAEDLVVSQVGRRLYETFFRGYTRKQWGLDPSQLDKSVTARIPVRFNDDDRYFTDRFQFMPALGYAALFNALLDHPNIEIATSCEFEDARREFDYDQLIFTGPIDEYFGFRFGELPYRSLRFEHQTLERTQFQPVGTVNYPAEWVPYTRITEFKHLTGQEHRLTSVVYEYPQAQGDPYYPIPREENENLYRRYRALAEKTPDVHFVGRLATYRYYNMDQVVGQSLALCKRLASPAEAITVARTPTPAGL